MKNQYFAYRSFWPELETMKKFRENGVKTFCFMVSNSTNSLGEPYTKYPPIWKFYKQYELKYFDQQIQDILKVIPDAEFICHVDLNTPHWWSRYMGAMGMKFDSFYELGKIINSEVWQNDTIEYMEIILKYATKHYGNIIKAFTLGLGGATEWHDRCRGEESVFRLKAFREWQKKNGKVLTDIPGRMERDKGYYDMTDNPFNNKYWAYYGNDPSNSYKDLFPNGSGLIRTPETSKNTIDYWRFCNQNMVEIAKKILSKAKEIVQDKQELGMFFGYAPGQWMQCSSGHLEFESLLKEENLDFVMAPMDYIGRKIGHGPNSMTVSYTINSNGKRMLQEMDQRTYTSNFKLAPHIDMSSALEMGDETWRNDEEIVCGLKRDISYCLIKHNSLWMFDMWGGFYQGEKVFSTIKCLKDIWDKNYFLETTPVEEILLVQDMDSIYYLNDMDNRCGALHQNAAQAFSNAGIPCENAIFSDLFTIDLDRFKLIVFEQPLELDSKKLELLKEKVCINNRHVLYLYGPGIVCNGKYDEDNVKKICGAKFKSDGLVKTIFENHNSWYLYDSSYLDKNMAYKLASEAKCHLYFDEPKVIFANNKFLMLHTKEPFVGEIKLLNKCSEVCELFSGEKYYDTDKILINTKGNDTFLFKLESIKNG